MEKNLGTANLFVIFLGHCSCSCPIPTYGFQCGYQCHCLPGDCDSTSGCNSGRCSQGWSGATCHKHTHRRNGIQVYLTNTNTIIPSGLLCYTVTGRADGTDINDTLSVPCDGRGRYVLLYTITANDGDALPKMDFGEVEVDACDPGTFGADCENYCHCKDGVCNDITGVCPPGGCLAGWKGSNCDVKCHNTYGDGCSKSCSNRHCGTASSCDHVTGECDQGCSAGWKGVDCVTECVDNAEYGPDCRGTCSARRCKEAGSPCPRDTGRCDGGCQPGWEGEDCTSKCHNTYGDGCSKSCSNRHCGEASSCDHVTGECDQGCSAGWKGVDCVTECAQGTEYGVGCNKTCSTRMCQGDTSTCPRDTGRCPDGCQAGWRGVNCRQACVQSVEYGVGCNKTCSTRMCQGDASTCPRDTGRCDGGCQAGWKGEDCSTACVQGTEYGVECNKTCRTRMCQGDASTCPRDTGQCTDGCQEGWKGEDCRQECVDGVKYGVGCVKNCSARKCKEVSSTCPRDTGRCDGGCELGWEGMDCMLECRSGMFGVNCSSTCGHCVDDEPCHHVTGTCLKGCSPGWVNETCGQECQSRTFGVNCSSTCGHCVDDGPCHHVTGTCLKGCSPGWVSDTCQQVNSQTASPLPGNGAVVGGAVGGVVAVAVVAVTVLAVIFYRRKRNANKKRSDNSVYEDVSALEPREPELQAAGPSVNDGYDEDEEEAARDADGSGKDTAGTYYNIGPAIVTEVEVDKLGSRIRDIQATKQGFEKEYQKLISGFTHTYEDSQLEGNTGKNRFLQYYPYDYNRVVLDKLPGDPFSDYINASYINGFSREQAYIAAQAPNRKTVADFWRMIYQKNLTRIVMLTNLTEMGKVKCEPYWSDTSDLEAGPFSITVTKVMHRACWVIRELTATVKETGEHKIFYQFHFTKWPDHGTPDETHLVEFLWRVRKTPNPDTSPLLVHCSAGIGRTGTYIGLDYLLDRALSNQKVDVFRFACDMRRQRRNMIQTKEQYACVYTTLFEVLTVGDTFLTSLDFVKQRGRKTVFKMGNLTVPRLTQRVKADIQRDKAGKDIKGRVWVNGRTDILAVMMPSHLSMNGYLLTEAPSVTTASLFWKLTEEQESSTVIVLPDSHQRVSCFLPAPGESLDLGPVSVTCSTENTINPDIVFRNVQRQMEGDASPKTVRVYMVMMLPTDDHSVLLDLLEQVDLGTRGNTPNPVTVVFGENEKRVATLFCILSNIVLGIRYDNEVEIYNNIRRLGHLHANDLTQEEISVCYNVASTYLETQSVYANM